MVLNKFKSTFDLAWGNIRGCMLDQVLSCIIMSKKYVIRLSSREEGYNSLALYLMPSFPNAEQNGNKLTCYQIGGS